MKTALILLIACAATAANAAEFADGTTDLQKPRFVSIKGGSAMMRSGPGERFPILWEYKRPGLPMEILKEYEIWRQVRDPDGTIGWMNKALLTGQRTGIVKDQMLYVQAAAGVVADSVPEMEWRETEHKARALLRAAELVEEGLE